MQLQLSDRKLLYGAYALIAVLFIIVVIEGVIILSIDSRFSEFSRTTEKQLGDMKTQISSLGTIMNSHLIEYEKLKQANTVRDARLDAQDSKITEMNSTVNLLKGNFSEFKVKYIDLKDRYSNLLGYSENLKKGLEEFEASLMNKWQWIKKNAVLQQADVDSIRYPIRTYCGTDIKIPCIAAVLQLKEGFRYFMEYEDQIKSVSDFVREKGGDCEDWSLFMKSYINSQPDTKMIRAFAIGGGNDYELFQDGSNIYYYSNAHDVKIGVKGTLECVVICYDMGEYGHCVLAFANKTDGDIFERIVGAPAVEPQNGEFIGKVQRDENNNDIFYLKVYRTDYRLPIYILVTDDDLYLYDGKTWASYGSQYAKLERIKNPA